MNLRVPCFVLGLLSIAATGDPCADTGPDGGTSGGSSGSTPNVGQNGAACGTIVEIACCGNVGDPCSDDNGCCTGNCGGHAGDGGFGASGGSAGGSTGSVDAGSVCAEPIGNEGCTAGLSSRCQTGNCACTTDADCCIGSCAKAAIPGTSGTRCCLTSGQPCDANADCCSLTCSSDTDQCT